MSRYRASSYGKKAYIASRIRNFYKHKAKAELIPENENVIKPKIRHSLKIVLKFDGEPQMTISVDLTPWGAWSVSPTAIGKKIQQGMIGFKKSDKPISRNGQRSARLTV